MSEKRRSPFDQFWTGRPAEQSREKETEKETKHTEDKESTQPFQWSELMEDMSKTWKSVSPIIKPMIDKFKK
ncbi:hypothetical protein [Halobacillus salinus]|uniref:hypothetical protein n=1 Tax=Halobacillus salinus TaxID=192814 RepID=UPI0009A7A6BB|nr:hypothetical protein [Halobacillus salinus]